MDTDCEDFSAKTETFLSWLTAVGVRMSPKATVSDLRFQGRGRGVAATGDFQTDEVVFSIPREAVFNMHNFINSQNDLSMQEAVSRMPGWLGLTACIILECARPDSKWAPYFAILPEKLDSLVFWSESELSELQASSVRNKIGKSEADHMFSHHIFPLGIADSSLALCHRVASAIIAYAFDIPVETDEQTNSTRDGDDDGEELVSDDGEEERTVISMVPLADLLNADGNKNNARLFYENEDLEMRAIKPILRGEEILNDYGQLPRSDLLRRYGYITDQYAPYDVVELSTSSLLDAFRSAKSFQWSDCQMDALSSKEIERRTSLAEREGAYDESYDIVHAGSDGSCIPDEMLVLVYLLLSNEECLDAIWSSRRSLRGRSMYSTELVGRVLVILLKLRELEYATTVEEDQALLNERDLSSRLRMAVQVRLGEKMLLREAVGEAQSFVGDNASMRFTRAIPHGALVEKEDAGPRRKLARHN